MTIDYDCISRSDALICWCRIMSNLAHVRKQVDRLAASAAIAILPVGQALADTKAMVAIESAYCELNPASNTYANGSAPLSIMHTSLATNQAASFIVNPSLVTGLYTSTTVKSNGGSAGSATATGYVNVTVVMDSGLTAAGQLWDGKTGTVAFPFSTVNATGATFPGVTFDSRTQTLTATLGQAITSSCLVNGSIATCGAEQITLMLSTTSAHSFNFILPNVGVGPHSIDVITQVSPETLNVMGTGGGSSSSAACYGAGSVVVDSVRLGNGFSCTSTGCSAN